MIHAETLHQPATKPSLTPVLTAPAMIAPPELARPGSRFRPGVGLLTAAVMVIALALLVHPDRSTGPASTGLVLGESASQPLRVNVTVKQPTGQSTVSTTVVGGTLAEALSRTAGAVDSSFSYTSRGSSIYLASFADRANNATGRWEVRLNGQVVNDLSLVILNQADSITVTWL